MKMSSRLFVFVYFMFFFLCFGLKLGECKKKGDAIPNNNPNSVTESPQSSSGKFDKLKKGNVTTGATTNGSKKEKKKKEEIPEALASSAVVNNGGDIGDDDNSGIWKNGKSILLKDYPDSQGSNHQPSMNSEDSVNRNVKGNEKKKEDKEHLIEATNKTLSEIMNGDSSIKHTEEERKEGPSSPEHENIKGTYVELQKTNIGKEESLEAMKKKKEKIHGYPLDKRELKEMNKNSWHEQKNMFNSSNSTNSIYGNGNMFGNNNNNHDEPPNENNLYHAMKSPYSDQDIVHFFKNDLKDSFFYRNGLDFSVTSVYLYNQYVDIKEHVPLKLKEGEDRMIILVTGNKLFFNDLTNSKEKEKAIRKKFVFLMNQLIDNLKMMDITQNFTYTYLFRTDPCCYDSSSTQKLLDYDLLGELSQATQTIYLDERKQRKVSMHKIYGGWFQPLGVLLVGGFHYVEQNKPIPVDIIPAKYMSEFVRMVNEDQKKTNEEATKLWRDYPNEGFRMWRYSVELLMWECCDKLPHELPHPSKFVSAYKEKYQGGREIVRNKEPTRVHNEIAQYTGTEILNWHMYIKKVVEQEKGLDLIIVSIDDYYKHMKEPVATAETRTDMNASGYALLILLNKNFFDDDFIYSEQYQAAKKKHFYSKLARILSKLHDVLVVLKEFMESEEDPRINIYDYIGVRENESFGAFDPHVIGQIAGVTKYLQCKDYMNEQNCLKNVSVHYKYGGWFQFGGLIHVKNVNYLSLTYEKHDFLTTEQERKIISLANGELEKTELWRDLPTPDISKYRYPLHVFLLENTEFHMKHLEKAHPFIFVHLLDLGFSKLNEKVENGNPMSTFSKFYKTHGAIPKSSSALYSNPNEHRNKNTVTNPTPTPWVRNQNECTEGDTACLKRVQETKTLTSSLDLNGKSAYSQEEDGVMDSSKEPISSNPSDSNNKKEEEDTINLMDDFFLGSNSVLKDLLNEELRGNTNEAMHNFLEESDIKEVNALYDSDNEEDQNLEMLMSTNEDELHQMHRKIIIILLVGILALVLSIVAIIGVKLYATYVKNKIHTKDQLVTSFKEKEEIPVVQGIPAPWLNA